MKNQMLFIASLAMGLALFLTPFVDASELIIEVPLQSGVTAYEGDIIAQSNCTVDPDVEATLEAYYEVRLKPDFHAKRGSFFVAKISDDDGLPNAWEMKHFGHLGLGPDDDPDGDGYTNLVEYGLGTDPTLNNNGEVDTDGDGLPDQWELKYFGSLSQTSSGDYDGDGYSNYFEYKSGSDPSASGSVPGSSYVYEYDSLGRLKRMLYESGSRGGYEILYEYDGSGNIIRKQMIVNQ